MKVLIIEDDEHNLNGLMRLIKVGWKLDDYPLEIVGVTTLAEGLKESKDANVTLLDLDLPDSGLLNTIQSIPLFPPPVIVLTGSDDPAVSASCYEHKAAMVYHKGSTIRLLGAVFEALQKDVIRRAESRNDGPQSDTGRREAYSGVGASPA